MRVHLAWTTPPAWAGAALQEPLALLSDHAHCELGAAAAAQSLLARRPAAAGLVERMGALAVEELQHFRRVHRLLRELGGTLAPATRNPYVAGLHAAIAPARGSAAGDEPGDPRVDAGMVDRLLVAALIERRSLERFERLATADAGGALGRLYGELAPSEAGHASLFSELALAFGPEEHVANRLRELAAREGRLVRGLPPGPRIHSGPPSAGPTAAAPAGAAGRSGR